MARISLKDAGSRNALAGLDLIAWSEGTSTSKHTKDDGYDVVVGGVSTAPGPYPKTWDGYKQDKGHPNILVVVNRNGLASTAFGRYQFLYGTWTEGVRKYGFRGRITPEAQDLMALKKINERKALQDLHAGRIEDFITKCNREWASFTGSPYNQRTHAMKDMVAKFIELGGEVAAV